MGFLGKLRRGKWNPFNRRRNVLDRRKTRPTLSYGKFRNEKRESLLYRGIRPDGESSGKNRRMINIGRRKTDKDYPQT